MNIARTALLVQHYGNLVKAKKAGIEIKDDDLLDDINEEIINKP
jgi:hypothetical protein